MSAERSPESFIEARLRSDARARRSPASRELVGRVLAHLEDRPKRRSRARYALRSSLAAAALLLFAGALFWPERATKPLRTASSAPPEVIAVPVPRYPGVLQRALKLREALNTVLAAEGQGLVLDLQHVNDAIWSGLPVRSRAGLRRL